MNKFSLVLSVAMAAVAAGCSADTGDSESSEEESVDTHEEAVTRWRNNVVTASGGLWLRHSNATNAATIGKMPFCSTFYVDYVDWGSGMAFGYSYNLGHSGWARYDYLTAGACISGGGEG